VLSVFLCLQAEQARLASLSRLAGSPTPGRNTPEPGISTASTSGSPAPPEAFNISPDECIRRLRLKGQPIRLFGETDKERRLRLRALELIEERGGAGGQGLNDFRKTLADMENGMDARDVERKAKASHRSGVPVKKGDDEGENGKDRTEGEKKEDGRKMKVVDGGVIDLKLVKSDPNKLYPLIYFALKVSWFSTSGVLMLIWYGQNVLKEWEDWMDARPGELVVSDLG